MRLELFFGKEIFVDTNIFVYALARRHRHKRKCNDLLVQINHGDIAGFTSSTVINELFHSNVVIVSVNFEVLKKAREISEKYDLLLSDAIHAATCKIYAISDMATNDGDFNRVDFIRVWKP